MANQREALNRRLELESLQRERATFMGCKVKVNRHGFLGFRIYWNGREFSQGTGWRDTPNNRIKAQGKAVEISEEIRSGKFSYLKWFPRGNKAHEFGAPAPETSETLTVKDYYDEWIREKTPPLVRKSRARSYRSHFVNHVLPLHGHVRLSAYGVAHIRELRVHLIEKKKISLKTAKNVVGASLRALFRDAKAYGKIDKNPFLDLPRQWWPRVASPEPDPFTEAERDKIIEFFFKEYWSQWPQGFVFLYTLFWGGERPSELTARRWRDVDLTSGMLSITTSRTEGEEGAPKTTNSRRTIPLLKPVVDYLEQIKPLGAKPDDYIFIDQQGRPINQWDFSELFQDVRMKLKIRHRDFDHTLPYVHFGHVDVR